jgi:hypothetical protein
MPVRLATAVLFIATAAVAVATPVPNDLPALAMGQMLVYRLEILLALFYGGLLVLTPLFHGLSGRLPIEISHRGAKWPAPSATERADERIERLEAELDRLQSKHC